MDTSHPPGSTPTQTPRVRRRVLLAEDAEFIGERLADTLTRAGWDVERARDANHLILAVAHPRTGALPDVVLLDPLLPGGNGLDALRRIHANWPDLPVVVIETRGAEIPVDVAQRLGAADVALRPVDPEALGALLARTVVEATRRRRTAAETAPVSAGSAPVSSAAPAPAAPAKPSLSPPLMRAVPHIERRGPLVGERRIEERFTLDYPRKCVLKPVGEDGHREATVRDVASRGLLLRHQGGALHLGQKVTVEIVPESKHLGRLLASPAVVRWTQTVDGGADAGIEFDAPDNKTTLALVYDLLVED